MEIQLRSHRVFRIAKRTEDEACGIYAVAEVPYALTGKKMEVPVRKILMSWPLEKAASRDTMTNPRAIDFFVRLAQEPAVGEKRA